MADVIDSSTETTTPAAPAAPATPGNVRSALEALRAAREAPAPEEAPAPQEQPEAEGETEVEAEGDAEVEAEAEGDAGAEAGAEAQDGGEDEPEGEGETPEGEDEPQPFVLALPGRRAGDPDLEIPLDGLTPEEQEAINRLRNGYMRGEALRERQEQVEARASQVEQMRAAIRQDPAAFVQNELARNRPAMQQIVMDHLVELLDDESEEARGQYTAIIEQLSELEEDPVRRENHKLKRERERTAAQQTSQPDPEVMRVVSAVKAMVPPGTPPSKANAFAEDALRAIHRDLAERQAEEIAPEEVQKIARRYLLAHGLEAHAEEEETAAPDGQGKKPAAPAQAVKAAPRVRRVDPKETGKALVDRSRRVREAASTPAGGGAPPIAPTPVPKGGGIKEAIAALRKNRSGG